MGSEDEFRKVSEDVRQLARALRGELKTAKWEAKRAAKEAKHEWQSYYHQQWHGGYRGQHGWYPPAAGANGLVDGAPPVADPAAGGDQAGYHPGFDPGFDPGANPHAGPQSGPRSDPRPNPGSNTGPPNGASGRAYGPGYGPGPGAAPGSGRPAPGTPGAAWGEWLAQFIPQPPATRPRTAGPPVWQPPRPPRPPRPPKPERQRMPRAPIRHKRDGSTLISLLLVLAGLAWLASVTHIFTVSLELVLATVLVIVGAAMVVTARTDWGLSHKHWPVWLGAALIFTLLVTANGNVIGNSLSSLHFGPISEAPMSWNELDATPTNFAGPLTLDLSQLSSTGSTTQTIKVRNTFGPITLDLPAHPQGYAIVVKAHTTFGPGNFIKTFAPAKGVTATTPVLTIDANGVFGPVALNLKSPAP